MDVCLQRTSESGTAPASVSTRDLAERVLELYWPHTAPFSAEEGGVGRVLTQNAGGQAEIVSTIARFRDRCRGDRSVSLSAARRAVPGPFERLIDQIEWKLIEMPLPRLQMIGDQQSEFLYRIGWDRSVRRKDIEAGRVDRRIHFVDRAGEHLVQLAGILRPLIERQWVSMVAGLNRDVTGELVLQQFLFGADRISLEPVRSHLRDLQNDRCFYCDDKLRAAPDVDHFLPWARFPDNGIDNLVAADQRCNNRKRDFLASAPHLENWCTRLAARSADLAEIAQHIGWDRHTDRTLGVARAIYLRLPHDVKLWDAGSSFVDCGAESVRIRSALTMGGRDLEWA